MEQGIIVLEGVMRYNGCYGHKRGLRRGAMEREPLYGELRDSVLNTLLDIHRKNLEVLEQQAAVFTFLHVPSHIVRSIELEEKAIKSIKAELIKRKEVAGEVIPWEPGRYDPRPDYSIGERVVRSLQENLSKNIQYLKRLKIARGVLIASSISIVSIPIVYGSLTSTAVLFAVLRLVRVFVGAEIDMTVEQIQAVSIYFAAVWIFMVTLFMYFTIMVYWVYGKP